MLEFELCKFVTFLIDWLKIDNLIEFSKKGDRKYNCMHSFFILHQIDDISDNIKYIQATLYCPSITMIKLLIFIVKMNELFSLHLGGSTPVKSPL